MTDVKKELVKELRELTLEMKKNRKAAKKLMEKVEQLALENKDDDDDDDDDD